MKENSDSQFFRTASGIQPGQDALEKSRFFMTFLTILGVTEILYSLRLVLEGKTGKGIPQSSRLEFLEKFSENNFALSKSLLKSILGFTSTGLTLMVLWYAFNLYLICI